ncbi:expressed unknown protein [Seminavis robusta]|uniref:Glycoside hydrolase family 79 protein n=1 Tax=Seminavis robusta TaxID=568900 RepID=A0A9N8HV29_9STRA|nr:expressed unknown protein [Seminavis robusta]|eukprot:Sro1457_g274330.1 n/a (568) ;mRNA; f:9629-11332
MGFLLCIFFTAIVLLVVPTNSSVRLFHHPAIDIFELPSFDCTTHHHDDILIPPDFVGISVEWNRAETFATTPAIHRLLQYLVVRPSSSRRLNIRVGGNSADRSWWNNDDDKEQKNRCRYYPPGARCVETKITSHLIVHLAEMARRIGGTTLILDLSMIPPASNDNHTNNTNWARQEWEGIWTTLEEHNATHLLEGIEIGNEQDIYGHHGIRPQQYTPTDFANEFQQYIETIQQTLPFPNQKMIRGGTFCCNKQFLDHQVDLMKQFQQYLYSWSYHHYPVSTRHCRPANDTTNVTLCLLQLLDNTASNGEADRVSSWAAGASSMNISFHMGEVNSANDGGVLGVSDALASTLWCVDYLFAMAATGNVTRVNFHGGGRGAYSWFAVNVTKQHQEEPPHVRPLFYGMYLWNWVVAGNDTRVHPLSSCRQEEPCTPAHKSSSGIHAKAWAVQDKNTTKVVIINKLSKPHRIQLLAPASSYQQQAEVVVLKSNSGAVTAKNGISFAGWTWDGTQHGERLGKYQSTWIHPEEEETTGAKKLFHVVVAPYTIAVVSFFQKDSTLHQPHDNQETH